jgi:hypothetical protein
MNHRERIRRRGAIDGRSSGAPLQPAGDQAPAVDLRIEHLVLNGFSPADRHSIADAVQNELARLLGEQGLPSGMKKFSELEHLNGGTIRLTRGARGAAIGSQIAHAVHGAFANGESENLRGGAAAPVPGGTPAKR